MPQSARKLVSALTGEGIAELVSAIGESLVPIAPPAGTAVAFTAEQVAGLDAARIAIESHDAAALTAALEGIAGWARVEGLELLDIAHGVVRCPIIAAGISAASDLRSTAIAGDA